VDDQGDQDERCSDLCEQHRRIKEAFVYGRVTPARGPVAFNKEQLARLERVRGTVTGSWLVSEHEYEYLGRLEAGGRLGDPLPAAPAKREPFITGIADDFEVRIASTGDHANVVVLFSHEHWPGVRFGHRFPPPDEADGYEDIWLKEAVETGGLGRLMGRHPNPDGDGIVWTDWGELDDLRSSSPTRPE
jgi:hypothetical protein